MNLWLIEAVTSVRTGDGTAIGVVDLPLARELPTDWPLLPGSGLKGALRADRSWRGESVDAFGSTGQAGSVQVTDGFLLALPVRSAAGRPALLTCPLALHRLARHLPTAPPVPALDDDDQAAGPERHRWDLRGGLAGAVALVGLEDLDLLYKPDVLADWRQVLQAAPVEDLLLVSDRVFGHACRAWTELNTRNAIDERGVVEDSKLFSVERLPPGTLFWTLGRGLASLLAPDRLLRLGGHRGGGAGRVVFHPLFPQTEEVG